MKRLSSSAALFMVLILSTSARCLAQVPRNMNEAIISASTIVVGRLDQYIPEPESLDRSVQERMRSSGAIAGGNAEMAVMSTINPRGTYAFHVISTVKGHPRQPLIMRFPRITSGGNMSGGTIHYMPLKANYLLILNGDEKNGFTCPIRSPITVGSNIDLPAQPVVDDKIESQISTVVQLIIDSLADPNTRSSSAYFLQNMTGENVVKAMRPYLDDRDDGLRASAIECLATNQDVTVIPKLAAWKYSSTANGNPLITSLSKFKTPVAIPYLNQLLLDKTSPYIPLNAAQALRQLPLDKSSTPFWMVALHDTEQQGIAAYDAYSCLHKMYPELGEPQNVAYFRANRAAETQKLDTWWVDEQAGKHGK